MSIVTCGARSLWMLAAVVALAANASGQVAGRGTQTSPPTPSRDNVVTAATGTARIRGRVVHADTAAPLHRALVTLTGEQSFRRQVTTDRDGRYEFAALPAGRFTVSATKGGYLNLQHGQRRPFEPGRPLELNAAQVLSQVDLALPRAGVIAGRIVDDRGAPLVGAEITVERYQYNAEGQRRLNRVLVGSLIGPLMTNDLGEFRAFGLMPGEYVVSAYVRAMPQPPGPTSPTTPSEGFLQTYYPGVASLDEAQSVPVGLAQEVPVQYALLRGRLSRITGTIVDSNGQPARGANLMLTTMSNGATASGRGIGTVAADGSFTADNVAPGEHFVQVRLTPSPTGVTVPEVANSPVSTSGADVIGLRITTSPGTTAVGRVEWEGRAPRTGADGPLRIVTSAADKRPAILGLPSSDGGANGTVGADDTFRIAALMGRVLFTPTGVPPQWTLKAVIVNGEDVTVSGADATGLGGETQVRVVLTDKVTDLTGTVRTAGGAAATDYVVVVLPESPVEAATAARYTRTARPDQRGAFRLRALPPGRYVAVAVEGLEQGSEWDPVFQATVRPTARRFTLSEGQRLALDLELMP